MPIITPDGVVRFWIGTVVTFASVTTSLWVARAHLHHRPSWLVAVAVGLGTVGLALVLRWNRTANGPYFIDLLVAAGLVVAGFYAAAETGAWAQQTPGHDVLLWLLPVANFFFGFLFVFSIGNYPE
jgi:hypothetical protein